MIRKLLKSVREYKKESILTPTFVAMEVVLECLLPLIMASLIDHMTGNDMGIIVRYGIVLVILALMSLA